MCPFDDPQTANEAAFGQGKEDRANANTADEIAHAVVDLFNSIGPTTERQDCYDAGWHDKDRK